MREGKAEKPVSLKGEAAEYLGLKIRQVAVNKERSDIFCGRRRAARRRVGHSVEEVDPPGAGPGHLG